MLSGMSVCVARMMCGHGRGDACLLPERGIERNAGGGDYGRELEPGTQLMSARASVRQRAVWLKSTSSDMFGASANGTEKDSEQLGGGGRRARYEVSVRLSKSKLANVIQLHAFACDSASRLEAEAAQTVFARCILAKPLAGYVRAEQIICTCTERDEWKVIKEPLGNAPASRGSSLRSGPPFSPALRYIPLLAQLKGPLKPCAL